VRRHTSGEAANRGGFIVTEHRALDIYVLAVAVERVDGWTAYITRVYGDDHSAEAHLVARTGSKLPEPVARLLFPFYDDEPFIA